MKYYIKFLVTDTILSWLLVMQLVNNIPAWPFVSNFVTWTFWAACFIYHRMGANVWMKSWKECGSNHSLFQGRNGKATWGLMVLESTILMFTPNIYTVYMTQSNSTIFPTIYQIWNRNGVEYENGEAPVMSTPVGPAYRDRFKGSKRGGNDLFGPLHVASFTMRSGERLFVNGCKSTSPTYFIMDFWNLCKMGINVSLCSGIIFENNNSLELTCCTKHHDNFLFNIYGKENITAHPSYLLCSW